MDRPSVTDLANTLETRKRSLMGDLSIPSMDCKVSHFPHRLKPLSYLPMFATGSFQGEGGLGIQVYWSVLLSSSSVAQGGLRRGPMLEIRIPARRQPNRPMTGGCGSEPYSTTTTPIGTGSVALPLAISTNRPAEPCSALIACPAPCSAWPRPDPRGSAEPCSAPQPAEPFPAGNAANRISTSVRMSTHQSRDLPAKGPRIELAPQRFVLKVRCN